MDACSFWQFAACVEGHNKANSADDPPAPTNENFDDMVDRLNKFRHEKELMN